MLKTDYIKSVKVIKKGKMDEIVLPSVSYHSISKKEKAMEQEVLSRKIPKTSPYGNYVFAYLSKLGVCEWKEESIIVDGDVTIAPPYGVTDVSGENEEHVNEVKERLSNMK
ncbi:uncharacterized protein [Blastocystis hominis]|uniref:AD domain-containing protein n=1 Tax=Blastocystis hominis TaxID=12968 RepID=D8M8A2_BLAHO|nr:uncharacterized protein [Blastocystis hominis]CBK24291.2 unnamed protein product [Blastocystis hominis]|eukprot:XP_012898339.1 uncharacterized protein [Blastocystis hominis]